jgi:hypothetical protein
MAQKMDQKMVRFLDEFVRRLKAGAGHNLKAVVLYGSVANESDNLPARQAEMNILCLLDHAGASDLEALGDAAQWLTAAGAPAPQFFTPQELERCSDVFAIELLDMKRHHRILFGDDFLARMQVPMQLHRLQVERDLRTNWLRLRQAVLLARGNKKELGRLLIASVVPFTGLFRHALIALGEEVPTTREEVISRIAHLAGVDASPFQTAMAMREGKALRGAAGVGETLTGYLSFIERAIDEIDRRLESRPVAG